MHSLHDVLTSVPGSKEHEPGEGRELFLSRNLLSARDRAFHDLRETQNALRLANEEISRLKADIRAKDEALALAMRYVQKAKAAGVRFEVEIPASGGFGMLRAALGGGA